MELHIVFYGIIYCMLPGKGAALHNMLHMISGIYFIPYEMIYNFIMIIFP